jgi:hypothetical protein
MPTPLRSGVLREEPPLLKLKDRMNFDLRSITYTTIQTCDYSVVIGGDPKMISHPNVVRFLAYSSKTILLAPVEMTVKSGKGKH